MTPVFHTGNVLCCQRHTSNFLISRYWNAWLRQLRSIDWVLTTETTYPFPQIYKRSILLHYRRNYRHVKVPHRIWGMVLTVTNVRHTKSLPTISKHIWKVGIRYSYS